MRYLLLTVGLASALLALFAGAYGDLPSWQRDWPGVVAWMTAASRGNISWTTNVPRGEANSAPEVGSVVSGPVGGQAARPEDAPVAPASPNPAAPASPPNTTLVSPRNPDPVRRQTPDPRTEANKEAQELATLRENAEQARQELAALREQHQREQAALEQANATRKAVAERSTSTPPADRTVNAAQSQGTVQANKRAATPSPTQDTRVPVPPAQAKLESRASTGQPSEPATKPPPAVQRLMEARTALASGQGASARRLLSLAQSQMTSGSSASDPRNAGSGSLPATQVGYAIGMLNRGDSTGALRAIDQALTAADGGITDTARQNYRTVPDPVGR